MDFLPIKLDLGLFYSLMSFVCFIVVAILLNRITSTRYQDVVDRRLMNLCRFFLAFCGVDVLWGLFESRLLLVYDAGLSFTTYVFFVMSFLASFFWTGYMTHYMGMGKKTNRAFTVLRAILLAAQTALLFSNFWLKDSFSLSATGEYQTGDYRDAIFAMQFVAYGVILLYAVIQAMRDAENRKTYLSAVFFALIQIFFGGILLAFPDGPFYTAGFTVNVVAIYSFNITAQRERYIENLAAANVQMQVAEERIRQEEELEKAKLAAEAANHAKSTFLFNMSHDIRTPMNAIIGFNNMAKRNLDDPEKLRDCLDKTGVASEHLLSILNDVLDMSRIESGKVTIDEQPVLLTKCGEDLMLLVSELAKQKNIRLHVDETQKINGLRVYADEMRMNRIFMNIFSNAVKYSPNGSDIFFTVRELPCDEAGKITLESVIRDTGIGMSEEFLAHIFEAFTRENTATVSGIQGTGLGMAITKSLVDLMDGDIDIQSKQGVGTTVTLRFSFRLAEAEDVTADEDREEASLELLKGRHVLLAEDNELNREIACDLLDEYEMLVDEAEDGTVAVQKFADSLHIDAPYRYDVVLMDVQMPRMDGYQATAELRRLEAPLGIHTPIIAMTANAFAEDRQNSLNAGMDAHLSKPIEVPKLLEALKSYLR